MPDVLWTFTNEETLWSDLFPGPGSTWDEYGPSIDVTAPVAIFTPPITGLTGYIDYNCPPTGGALRHAGFFANGIRTSQNIYMTTDDTITTTQPRHVDQIKRIFYGGHQETITSYEQGVLAAAGYGDFIVGIDE